MTHIERSHLSIKREISSSKFSNWKLQVLGGLYNTCRVGGLQTVSNEMKKNLPNISIRIQYDPDLRNPNKRKSREVFSKHNPMGTTPAERKTRVSTISHPRVFFIRVGLYTKIQKQIEKKLSPSTRIMAWGIAFIERPEFFLMKYNWNYYFFPKFPYTP